MMSRQEALPLVWPERYSRENFVVAENNRRAFDAVMHPETWINPAALLIGEFASGKTHLVRIFQEVHGAFIIKEKSDIASAIEQEAAYFVIDDCDTLQVDEELFHLFNAVLHGKHRLLLTAASNPENWVKLPDLLSRLKAAHPLEVQMPDEASIKVAYQKMFNDRGLFVDNKVLDYLALRTERRFASIFENVSRLDQLALQNKKRVTIPLIQESGIFA